MVEIYFTEAMINREWMKSHYKLRHTMHLATHGFHHKICQKSYYHIPEANCIYHLCDRPYVRDITSSHLKKGFNPYSNEDSLYYGLLKSIFSTLCMFLPANKAVFPS